MQQLKAATSGSAVERLLGFWREDGWPTLRLAAPVMVARAGIIFMVFVDSIVTGRSGASELAFLAQGFAAQSVMMMIAIGLLQGSMVLIAQAYGAGEKIACGEAWKAAMTIAGTLGVLFAGVFFLVEPALRATGLDPELARGAGRVSQQFAWGLPPMLLYVACGYFLESIKRPLVGMSIMLAANVLNIVADGVFVLGWFDWVTPMGAVGAVMTTSAIRWLSFAGMLAFIVFMPDAASYGVRSPFPGLWKRVVRILQLGAPISIALGLEAGALSALTFMSGHLGATAAAAHLLTFNFNGVIFMTAVGMSAATAVRVGHAVGAHAHERIARAGLAGIVLGFLLMSAFGLVVLLLPQTISAIYIDDEAVWAISRQTLQAAALMIVFDGVMTITMGALRGMGDVRWPALLHGVAFWVVGVPVAYALAFPAGIGAVGLILGISLAMLVSLVLLGLRFRLVSARTIARA
ncbi:MAG: MATE family efflux transporter [Micropepsaceae bacterium]